jgi:uncharacterized protein YcbK (DUF882 family)
MRLQSNNSFLQLLTVIIFATAVWAMTISARAAGPAPAESLVSNTPPVPIMEYEVVDGDSLGAIAVSHGVSLKDLSEVNQIEDMNKIRIGTHIVIPGDPKNGALVKRGVRLKVPKGITLSRIAELYGVSVRKIARANGIKNPDLLRSGKEILIPGAKKVIVLVPPPPCYKKKVTVYRLRTQETHEVALCFCNGKPNPEALDILSGMSGPVRKAVPFPLHPRLVQLLQRVSEKFPDKRIEIVSGQRSRKSPGHESFHNKGQALDFKVADVSNKDLSKFVRSLGRVGVGYYPNSVFIHLDTRDKSAYWVDYSRPGEKSIYGRAGMTKKKIAEIRAMRRAKKIDPKSKTQRERPNKMARQDQIEAEGDAEQIVEAVVNAIVGDAETLLETSEKSSGNVVPVDPSA